MRILMILLTLIVPAASCADEPRNWGAEEIAPTEWWEDDSNFETSKIWVLTLIDVDGKFIDLDYGEHDRRHSLWTREQCMEQGIDRMKWALYFHKHPEKTKAKYIQYLGFICEEEEQTSPLGITKEETN